MNLFATVLTYPAPSANYRGESEENRSVIQKVTQGRFEYGIISPEAVRNALREMLAGYGLPCNRSRLHNEDQLAVEFKEYPDPSKFVDDFFFGYLLALDKAKREEATKVRGKDYPTKRDSILRMNLAKALDPYRHDAVLTQSPLNAGKSPWKNADSSALLHRETSVSAFQYPFAINLDDCDVSNQARGSQNSQWLLSLLKAISELNGVAGNHARSYFEMAPASIVIRLTTSLVAGYNTYAFQADGSLPEVLDGIRHDDYPGAEFYLGGQIVKTMAEDLRRELKGKGVKCFRMANQALDAVARLQLAANAGFLTQPAAEAD